MERLLDHYIFDDGIGTKQKLITFVQFSFDGKTFKNKGSYDYNSGVKIIKITFLGLGGKPSGCKVDGQGVHGWNYNLNTGEFVAPVSRSSLRDFEVSING